MASQSEQNIKMLNDINDYYEAHTSEFKQVYFSPASVSASATKPTGVAPIKSIPGQHTMQTCSFNASLEGSSYFSLTPTESGLFKCDIYAGTDISSIPVSKITKVMWQTPLPTDTSYVCLDMIGNLNAYNDKNQVVATIFKSQDPADKRTVPGRFHLVLVDNRDNRLQPLRIRNSKTNAALVVITVNPEHIVKNNDWASDKSNIVHSMSNEAQQTENRQISIDKITKTVSLVSNDYRYKLHIKDNALVLEATLKDKRQFYKTNADEKVGKLYYASTYPEYKFLKEVPGELQTLQSGNYTTYDEVYPDKNIKYDIKTGTNCTKECDADSGCRAVYTVVDSTTKQTMCFISRDAPTFNAKSNGSYESSELNVKNPVIKLTDPEYNKAEYISNGYNTGFASYNSSGLLEPNFIPGPNGTPYVQQLKQKITERTTGIIENMTTVERALNKLNTIEQTVSQHEKYQTDISNNVGYIKSKIRNIDTAYTDMSNNSFYKFTGTAPIMESEDTSIEKALINDNKVYMEEQRNVYAIAGLTMATLLVMAIIL
jgi:hypothetical protein